MNETQVLDFTLQALILVLVLSLPPIVVATLTGLMVSFLQAVTQIQEQTLSFAIKLISVIVTIALIGSWLGGSLFVYAQELFEKFPYLQK
ncbi:MAG: type III secretion system export apparatus subunit SctS [Candidatus Adiutrix sp.]|jgi:type III secretion HrpO family protein|nr:type III secretion system export apparatus subunit SctS [Candidatus Adiutrix sp.]